MEVLFRFHIFYQNLLPSASFTYPHQSHQENTLRLYKMCFSADTCLSCSSATFPPLEVWSVFRGLSCQPVCLGAPRACWCCPRRAAGWCCSPAQGQQQPGKCPWSASWAPSPSASRSAGNSASPSSPLETYSPRFLFIPCRRDKAPRWLLRKCSQNRFTLTFKSCGLGVTAGDWFQWSLN